MYLPRRELYLYLYPYPYPFPSLPTNQAFLNPHTINKKKQAPASIDHHFLFFPSPPRPARVRVCMCIYELMEGFSSLSSPVRTSPRPSAPLPPKKKKTFASAASPPLPCDGSSHIQSQLDKARQATCLPAKELRKKIRTPHPTMSRC